MIACICRNISENKYKDKQALYKRLLENDKQCCKCLNRYGIDNCKSKGQFTPIR